MALPTVVGVGSVSASLSGITPAMPAGVQAGDILLLFLNTMNQAITVSGGNQTWAQVTGSPRGFGAAGGVRLTVFWARSTSSSPTPPVTSDSGDHQLGFIMAVRGCVASGNPWDVVSFGDAQTFDSNLTPCPAITTTAADCLAVYAAAFSGPDSDSSIWNFAQGTVPELANPVLRASQNNSAGNGGGVAAATGERATAGAISAAGWFALSGGGTAAGMSMALKGAVSAQIVAIGLVTEADTAQAMAKAVAIRQTAEADTAQGMAKAVAIGQTVETDAAQRMGLLAAIGQATEADTALAITQAQIIALGLVTETDSAQALGLLAAIGQVAETDSSRAMGVVVPIGQATETETVQAMALVLALGQTMETDSALALFFVSVVGDVLVRDSGRLKVTDRAGSRVTVHDRAG